MIFLFIYMKLPFSNIRKSELLAFLQKIILCSRDVLGNTLLQLTCRVELDFRTNKIIEVNSNFLAVCIIGKIHKVGLTIDKVAVFRFAVRCGTNTDV